MELKVQDMYIFSQEQIFIFFIIIGFIIGIIFDIFRVLRKNIKTPDVITYFQDICFLFISGSIFLYGIIKLSNGEIRFHIFIAAFLGIMIYSLTLSKLCVIILSVIVRFCKKIISFPYFCYNLFSKLIKKGK